MERKARGKSPANEQERHARPTGWDELAQHSEIRHSAPEVNGVVGWRRSSFLPGEICPAWRPARAGSALASNGQGDRAEVSKGNSTEPRAGGGRSPFDQ